MHAPCLFNFVVHNNCMKIDVMTHIGEIITLEVVPTDTVYKVKALIMEKKGIPPDQQQLIFRGTQLEGDHDLNFYNIHDGSMLHLQLCGAGEYTCILICE